ncbi:hypothetical protein LINGRAHAP2_LOCUS8363, partial [Linum grandiflorum]
LEFSTVPSFFPSYPLLHSSSPSSPIINRGGDHHRRRSPPLSFRSSGDGGDLAPSPSLSLSLVCAGKRGCCLSSPLSSLFVAAASFVSLAQVTVDEDGQHSPEFVSDEVGGRRTEDCSSMNGGGMLIMVVIVV